MSNYCQRANRRGWVHYSAGEGIHVTSRDWWRWLRTWFSQEPQEEKR